MPCAPSVQAYILRLELELPAWRRAVDAELELRLAEAHAEAGRRDTARHKELNALHAEVAAAEAHTQHVWQREAAQARDLGDDVKGCACMISDAAAAADLLPWTTLERRMCVAERRILDAARRIERPRPARRDSIANSIPLLG